VLIDEEAGLEKLVVSLLQQISELKEKIENQIDALRNEIYAMKKDQVKLKETYDTENSYLRKEMKKK
jgi:regulator of replication initiation timing